jgi:hypothetical protein
MAKRVVIGARWLGREQKFVDYFDGYLAGLSVNFGEQIDEKVRLFKRIFFYVACFSRNELKT